MKKHKVLLSIMSLALFISSNAQDTIVNKIDKLLTDFTKPNKPGLAVIVIEKGNIIYKKGFGLADLEHNIPITPSTVFEIGSMSKQFTAFCALQLADKKIISLEDDINKYIPELKTSKKIKIINLITHTSGIRDYLSLFVLSGLNFDNNYSSEMVIDLISRQKKLKFNPGDDFSYSNSGYYILAEIIQRVSGKSLNQFADSSIFKPLGMNNTHFQDDYKKLVPNRAYGYDQIDSLNYQLNISFNTQVGPGRLYTTIEDLSKWDANFYNNQLGGGQKLIDQEVKPFILNNGKESAYACGLFNDQYKTLKTVSHGGSWAGYQSSLTRFLDKKLTIIFLSNNPIEVGTKRLNRKIADVLIPDIQSIPPKSYYTRPVISDYKAIIKDSIYYKKIAGIYYSEELNTIYEFLIQGNKLVVKWRNYQINEVDVENDDKLRINRMCSLILIKNKKKEIIGFNLFEADIEGIKFIKIK